MQTRISALLGVALVASCAFIGVYGSAYRAELTHAECVGKTYGTPGCPIKQISRSCGDAVVDPGEECDNGVGRNGEGNCSVDCQYLACGDGVLSADLGEECEPKREEVYAIDPDTGELTTELRFLSAMCGETCTTPTCGEDGVCSGGCRKIVKHACSSSSSSRSSASLRAAAPVVSSSPTSVVSPSSVPSSPPYVPRCGNGTVDPGEQCDDGNVFDTDDCTITCRLPRCGDGAVQKNEQCDDGNTIDTDSCTNTCARPGCGDGILQKDEQCDTGGNNSDYLPNACRTDCKAPRCGDAVVDNGEECDGGASCTPECLRVKSLGTLILDTSGAGKAAIGLSALGTALVLMFVFRSSVRRLVTMVAGEKIAKSIDDIPLDEIEMPWHNWKA